MDMSRFTIDERLHIPYAELKFLQEIGSGAFGKVFIGYVMVTVAENIYRILIRLQWMAKD